MYDRRNHAKRLLFGGLLLGSFAAVWLALVEVALVALGVGGARLVGAPGSLLVYDALTILVVGPLGGLVAGCVVALAHILAVRLAGKRALEPMWKGRFYVALALPLVASAVVHAFQGPWASHLPGVTWIALGAGVALLLSLWAVSLLVVHVAQRLTAGHAAIPLRLTAPSVLLVGSVGFQAADMLVLPRLYPFFHWMAAGGALVAAWMGIGALHLALGRDMRRRLGLLAQPLRTLILSTLVLGVGLLGHRAVGSSHRLRGLLFERTALSSKAMVLTARLGLLPSPAPLGATYSESEARPRPRPTSVSHLPGADVVLITVDALRGDRLGLAGYRRVVEGTSRSITPNIDRIFGHGLRFRRAYCPTPRTSYSLVSLLTGLPIYTLSQLGIDRPWPTLPELLRARGGYRTAGFYPEAIFSIDRPKFARYRDEHLGFGHFQFEDEDLPAEKRTDQVLRYLEKLPPSDKGRSRPLLLWAHYFDAHEPYRVRPGYEGFGTSPLARYEAEIAYVDAQVGRLVDAIRSRRRRVIFVLTSDHGEEFGEHGGANHGSSLFDEQVRVPLLVAGPGLPDREVWAPVSTTALASTLLGWLGVPAPPPIGDEPDLSGPLREGERYAPAVLVDLEQQRMVALGHHKLLQDRGRGYLALYDLKRDPAEQQPRDIDSPGEARRVASVLLGHLERRLRELGRLGRIGRVPDVGPLPVALTAADSERRRRATCIALGQAERGVLGEPAKRALRRAVDKDPDPEVRHRALAALALSGDTEAALAPRLVEIVGRWDLPDDLRLAFGISLARVGHPAALPALVFLLPRLRSLDQQLAVIQALGGMPMTSTEAVDSLVEALRDFGLSVPALRALSKLHARPAARDAVTRAVPAIYDLLGRRPEHWGHRLEALATLACLGTVEAEALLGRWLAEEPDSALVGRGLALLAAMGSGRARGAGRAPASPLAPLHGEHVEAPGGACLPGRGCRLEAAPVILSLEVPDTLSVRRHGLWLVVERGPAGTLPVASLDDRPLALERVSLATHPGDGVASLCELSDVFDVFWAPQPSSIEPGRRARLALVDPSGKGVVVRGVALLAKRPIAQASGGSITPGGAAVAPDAGVPRGDEVSPDGGGPRGAVVRPGPSSSPPGKP